MNQTLEALREDMDELSSAEDFLDYFGIAYDPRVVQINRLHILQRFHDYLERYPQEEGHKEQVYKEEVYKEEGQTPFGYYGLWLEQAYLDFVGSSAQEQKALRVFQRAQPGFVSLDDFNH